MAQRFIDEAQGEAEEKAREFTAAAQERAREIVNEARSRAEDEVNRLNGMKQRLSEDVETLAQQLNAERARIAQVLAEFTEWVETSLQADTAVGHRPTTHECGASGSDVRAVARSRTDAGSAPLAVRATCRHRHRPLHRARESPRWLNPPSVKFSNLTATIGRTFTDNC